MLRWSVSSLAGSTSRAMLRLSLWRAGVHLRLPFHLVSLSCAFHLNGLPSTTPGQTTQLTQLHELNGEDARHLIDNHVLCIGEISNMGCTPEAIDLFIEHKMMYAPGKAVNAGGVATSGLEMSQNSMRLAWTREEVDQRLKDIMKNIHDNAYSASKEFE